VTNLKTLVGNLFGRAPGIVVRPCTLEDLKRVQEIESHSNESARWEPEAYLTFECVVAEVNATIAGFMVSRTTAVREREILNIAVAPEFRRRGVASTLIGSLDNGEIFLEVRESNEPARQLYRKLGFAEIGRRPEYYENPPEAAVVMRLAVG
jgi:ribosomal-protein-alanine acetyltransferase